MSLTMGTGPLAFANRERFNTDLSDAPKHLLCLHDVDKRIRGLLAGQTVVDTRNGKLLHESAIAPAVVPAAERHPLGPLGRIRQHHALPVQG